MKANPKYSSILFLIIIFLCHSLKGDEIRLLRIGMLHNWFSSGGCEIEVGRRHLSEDQQDGFQYPALYQWQDMQAAKGLWVGTRDYADPLVDDKTYDYKVIHIGPRVFDETLEFMPQQFQLIGKFIPPEVTVNQLPASELNLDEQLDEIDPQLKADRMLYNVVNTSLGITITRKVYAYSQPGHDNYFIYDFKFENTGVYDTDGNRHNLTLTDVIFFFQYRWAMTQYIAGNGYGWAPNSAKWGHNTVNEILHPDYGDNYRAIYAWHGLHSEYPGNNIGGPNIGSDQIAANGFLGAPQFPGVLTLHADQSASDPSDDPDQFTQAPFFLSDHLLLHGNDQFDARKMGDEYVFMTRGIPQKTHAEKLSFPHDPSWQAAPFGHTENADEYLAWNMSGVSQSIGYGPYTLAPGDSIQIVMAECAGSIGWQKRQEIGYKWYHQIPPYILPDGNGTDDRNTYKDAWVFTGRDSLKQTFDRAMATWNTHLTVDPAPPPPQEFRVTSGGDHMILSWSDNAENYDHFGGYQLYRQVGTPDSSFELIYACGSGTNNPLVHQHKDYAVQRGQGYFYYIVSYDDGSVNTTTPGQSIRSSLFWTRTTAPAYLRRQPSDDLDLIRIVPNPFNYRSREYQLTGQHENHLMFYNLPPRCLIKIFTERGDLIKTIHHRDNSGEDAWDSMAKSGDSIVSGVYIAYIEVTQDYYKSGQLVLKKGAHVIRKFMIIK